MSSAELDWNIKIFLERRLKPEHLERAREFLSRFSSQGQIVLSALMAKAEENNRLEGAFVILEDFYGKYWKDQPLDERGNPHSHAANRQCINKAYTYLGLAGTWESIPQEASG